MRCHNILAGADHQLADRVYLQVVSEERHQERLEHAMVFDSFVKQYDFRQSRA